MVGALVLARGLPNTHSQADEPIVVEMGLDRTKTVMAGQSTADLHPYRSERQIEFIVHDHEAAGIVDTETAHERGDRLSGQIHERGRLGECHSSIPDAYLINEGAFLARFESPPVSGFEQVDDGESHVVTRAVVLVPRIAEADDEDVGRRAASGAITAPGAKCHLFGVALGSSLLGRSGGFATLALATLALGLRFGVLGREAGGQTEHQLHAVVDVGDNAGGKRDLAHGDRIADVEIGHVDIDMAGDLGGLGLHRERLERLIDDASAALDLLGFTDQHEGHFDGDRSVGVNAQEVDVQDVATDGMTLQILDDGEIRLTVDLEGDETAI